MRYYSSTAGEMRLMGAVTAGATTLAVNSVAGLPGAYPYTLLLDYGQPAEEIVSVTAASGTSLTVVRGQDGTSAQDHPDQAVVRHAMTAQDLREPQNHIAATAAHGVTGALVGTTDGQTLSAKTFTSKTVNDPALLVRAGVGQLRNIMEVTNPAGSGVPYLSVSKDGSVQVAGSGTTPPLKVVDRVDDTTTRVRFQVDNSGVVTLGSTADTTQSYLSTMMKDPNTGKPLERRSYITVGGSITETLRVDGAEVARFTMAQDGRLAVNNVKVNEGAATDVVKPVPKYAVSAQRAVRVGPLVYLRFTIVNNDSDMAAGGNGNVANVQIANIPDETWNPAGLEAVWTGRGYGGNGAILASGVIGTGGAVALRELVQGQTWTKGTELNVSVTYDTNQ